MLLDQILILISVFILGITVGSFLNVVIYRLPVMLYSSWEAECKEFLTERKGIAFEKTENNSRFNLAVPRSTCPHCKYTIPAHHNIPILSYLFLKGACGNCKAPISIRYPIVEFISGILAVCIIHFFSLTPAGYLAVIFAWSLLVLTLIDIDHQLLPDNITLPLMWLGIIANVLNTFTDLQSSIIGAAAGYLSLWSVYWLFKLLTGKEGMGFGDFKLLAALGAWFGWQYLPLIIVLSSMVGAVIGIGSIIVTKKDKNKPIPFGPYLALAGFITLLWGESILNWYLASATSN